MYSNQPISLPERIGIHSTISEQISDYQLTNLPDTIKNLTNLTELNLTVHQLTTLPDSIGDLCNLTCLDLRGNQLIRLPESIGDLCNLTCLDLRGNQLTSLPESICNLSNLTKLNLLLNQLISIPENVGNLSNLTYLNLRRNQLTKLPESIGNLSRLTFLNLSVNHFAGISENIGTLLSLHTLDLSSNKIATLPDSIGNLSNLISLYFSGNPLIDLPDLQNLSKLAPIEFNGVTLMARYYTNIKNWKSEWLLDEENVETRQRLIQQIGYERICQELGAIELDKWREYHLLKIDDVGRFIIPGWQGSRGGNIVEPMILLKMTCPSTGHIHILRVPPEMTSAEAAITWVNHGIHPDEFAVQT
ncbi:MAG: leucine-rich repeat domain-containing protein [Chamaesiphon sp.]|nr:leucine-rich repeat domain-containing protein [Chamaesiphon sp.]